MLLEYGFAPQLLPVWRFYKIGASRSQNQFAVLCQAQAVLPAIVLDDQFSCCSEQRPAGHTHRRMVISPKFGRPICPLLRLFHKYIHMRMLMILIINVKSCVERRIYINIFINHLIKL
jgi:hypothetical protein